MALDRANYSEAQLKQYFKRLFAFADTNGDGVLDRAEFCSLLDQCGFAFGPEEMDEMVSRGLENAARVLPDDTLGSVGGR